jgi:hypothetical protein
VRQGDLDVGDQVGVFDQKGHSNKEGRSKAVHEFLDVDFITPADGAAKADRSP